MFLSMMQWRHLSKRCYYLQSILILSMMLWNTVTVTWGGQARWMECHALMFPFVRLKESVSAGNRAIIGLLLHVSLSLLLTLFTVWLWDMDGPSLKNLMWNIQPFLLINACWCGNALELNQCHVLMGSEEEDQTLGATLISITLTFLSVWCWSDSWVCDLLLESRCDDSRVQPQ